MVTKEQAMTENNFEHVSKKNADGSPLRLRRNGKTKTWKTRPNDFRIPVKTGLYGFWAITHEIAHLFYVPKVATPVIFLIDVENSMPEPPPGHLFAFFPSIEANPHSDNRMSYSHNGQHSACSVDYARSCRLASSEEAKSLKTELESLGYTLEVLSSW